MLEAAFERVPRAQIFGQTGIQFMEINTLFQLFSMVLNESPELEIAKSLLMMPDLLNYWLTGRKVGEFSICTTSQCYDTLKGHWCCLLCHLVLRLSTALMEADTSTCRKSSTRPLFRPFWTLWQSRGSGD